MSSKKDQLKQIRDEIWDLKESPLYAERTKNNAYPVIGEGTHDANIMFIGEAPGKNEAATGKPFCGMSGRILDELLDHIKMPRETVYITNIVKDRPTNNRDPKKNEIELYAPFLDRQIEVMKPKVIATLGRFSMEYIMKRYELAEQSEPISKIHGKVFDAKLGDYEFKFVPLYHPAVSVYNRNTLPDLKKDFEILLKYK
jgi:uracil-DNA glycosylase family 4